MLEGSLSQFQKNNEDICKIIQFIFLTEYLNPFFLLLIDMSYNLLLSIYFE